MNEKKICFVTAVNDEKEYKECIFYINNLKVPLGYEIELLPIRKSSSIFNAYNNSILKSDAKYKVYLHQDLFILNKNFIEDILNIFNIDKSIGLIGVCGSKTLPASGIWWESSETYGKVYENSSGKLNLLSFKDVSDNYECVLAIDGLIMITQYDLKWREDILDGWHFYDISQSLEFKKLGFKTVVPKQLKPWCIHDCGKVDIFNYEKYRQIFLANYSVF